jgi:hypothetical protein
MSWPSEIGQAIIGALIVGGYVINQWQARSAAHNVSSKAEAVAGDVAAKVDAAAAVQAQKVEEIHTLVNSQSAVQLERIAGLEAQLKEARKQ